MGYIRIEDLLGRTDGMECLRNNSGQDDGTDTIIGVDWFKFNNTIASSIYVSGNMWVGLGANSEQLKPYRRDGKMWYLYRQEGDIAGVKFLKIRWEGWTQHNNQSDASRLIYELFLFDDCRMLLNVIQAPTSSSYYGTSTLVCGANTYALPLASDPVTLLFTPSDDTGCEWTFTAGELPVFADIRYLIRADGKLYHVKTAETDETDATDLIEQIDEELTADLFKQYGNDKPPASDILKCFVNPSVLCWTDAAEPMPISAKVDALPYPQYISGDIDMTNSTVKSIMQATASVEGVPVFAFSIDDTWQRLIDGEWIDDDGTGMTADEIQAITAEQWATLAGRGDTLADALHCRFKISTAEDIVKELKLTFEN